MCYKLLPAHNLLWNTTRGQHNYHLSFERNAVTGKDSQMVAIAATGGTQNASMESPTIGLSPPVVLSARGAK